MEYYSIFILIILKTVSMILYSYQVEVDCLFFSGNNLNILWIFFGILIKNYPDIYWRMIQMFFKILFDYVYILWVRI